jgi:aminoglycoside N3'-acetyltransferase
LGQASGPSPLPDFFQEIQDAFTQAGDEDSVSPIRHFYQRWGAAIAIGRRPSVATRLHAAERALADPDPAVRDQAVREAAEIVQAAYREVAGG